MFKCHNGKLLKFGCKRNGEKKLWIRNYSNHVLLEYLVAETGQEEQTGQVGWKWVPDAEGSADAAAAEVVASGGAAAGRQAAGLPTAAAAAATKRKGGKKSKCSKK